MRLCDIQTEPEDPRSFEELQAPAIPQQRLMLDKIPPSIAYEDSRKWVRTWKTSDWAEWKTRRFRRRPSDHRAPWRASYWQERELRWYDIPEDIIQFVTDYEAAYLLERLEREESEIYRWGEARKAKGLFVVLISRHQRTH